MNLKKFVEVGATGLPAVILYGGWVKEKSCSLRSRPFFIPGNLKQAWTAVNKKSPDFVADFSFRWELQDSNL